MNETEKIAILIYALGSGTRKLDLSAIDSIESAGVAQRLEELKSNPPSAAQVEWVLAEFDSFFRSTQKSNELESDGPKSPYPPNQAEAANARRSSVQQAGAIPSNVQPSPIESSPTESSPSESSPSESLLGQQPGSQPFSDEEPVLQFQPVSLSGHPVSDLNRFHPSQIALAIEGEKTKIMAVVVDCLSQQMKIAVLNQLTQDSQGPVLSWLISGHAVHPTIQDHIIKSVLSSAAKITSTRRHADDTVESIASLIAKLPREKRNNILSQLRENDKENSDRVRRSIFKFEDIVQYADKSIQRILSEIDKHNLIIALADSSEQVCERVFDNLSRRAKESLQEEMELHGSPSQNEIDYSRHCVADVIADLEINNQLDVQTKSA